MTRKRTRKRKRKSPRAVPRLPPWWPLLLSKKRTRCWTFLTRRYADHRKHPVPLALATHHSRLHSSHPKVSLALTIMRHATPPHTHRNQTHTHTHTHTHMLSLSLALAHTHTHHHHHHHRRRRHCTVRHESCGQRGAAELNVFLPRLWRARKWQAPAQQPVQPAMPQVAPAANDAGFGDFVSNTGSSAQAAAPAAFQVAPPAGAQQNSKDDIMKLFSSGGGMQQGGMQQGGMAGGRMNPGMYQQGTCARHHTERVA